MAETADLAARYDAAKPGDPFVGDPYAALDYCEQRSPDGHYGCTRVKGHDGQHVAEGEFVITVWPAPVGSGEASE